MAKPKTITARATVRLTGLDVGETAQVDPSDPRVAGLLRTGLLVSEEPGYDELEVTREPTDVRAAVTAQEQTDTPDDVEDAQPSRKRRAASRARESATDT